MGAWACPEVTGGANPPAIGGAAVVTAHTSVVQVENDNLHAQRSYAVRSSSREFV